MKDEHPHIFSGTRAKTGSWVRQLTRPNWPSRPRSPFAAVPTEGFESVGARLSSRTALLEWLLIFVVVLAFSAGFLDLGTQRALPGNEAEVFQSLDWVLVNSLSRWGQFPLWNPYLQTGLPFIADPMLHVFNPLVTVPVLLFGVLDGFKIALLLSFLAAGLGAWWLGAVLGMSRVCRLWIALMYALSGPAVARFSQGQYLFVLGFAWIPWSLAGLLAATKTRRKLHAVIAIFSLALLFFSGNVYFTYYMLFVIVLYCLVMLLGVRPRGSSLDRNKAGVLFIVGVLAIGLIAVQLLPLVEFWPHISKATSPDFADSQTVHQVFRDYVSKDKARADAIKTLPPQEFYAYIGIWPFLALILLPLAVRKTDKKPFLFFTLLFVFAVLWIDVRDMPWRGVFAHAPLLSQFRYPTRMLIYGAFAVIVLAGLAMDSLWRIAEDGAERWKEAKLEPIRWSLARLGMLLIGVFMIWSVADVYATNKQHAKTRDPYEVSYDIMRWLRGFDSSEYYVGNPNGWHGSVLSSGLRYIDAWYHFGDIRSVTGVANRRPVRARPHYLVLGNESEPDFPDPIAVREFETHTVYKLPHSLPFAFAVENETLLDTSERSELQSDHVSPLQPYFPGPNGVEVITEGDANTSLVVLMTKYPGWQVTVDGRKQELKNVGGYLATDLQAGIHKYVFSFNPASFKYGLILSLLSLLAVIGLLVSDLQYEWWRARERVRAFDPGVIRRRVLQTRQTLSARIPRPEMTYAGQVETGVQESVVTTLPVAGRRFRVPAVLLGWVSGVRFLEWSLFALALLAYAVTHLRALDRFPIYFFTDEAIQPLLAQDLIARSFHGSDGTLLPIYFEAAGLRWTPVLSVYFHALTVGLFGKSIFVTRATSALVSMLAAVAVGLILKWIFKARFWWAGVLLLAVMPAWFLHSRTAFETVMMSAFYACFLLSYLLYRCRSPRYLFAAVLFGAATFYSYSNGQLIVIAASILLFVSDIRYHLRNWRYVLLALLLLAVVAWPLIGFRLKHPTSMQEHLRAVDSYWFRAIPLPEKLERFAQTYWFGISPKYWFFPNNHDLSRHRMNGYGHIRIEMLPVVLLGVGLCLWRIRSSPHRAILLAALATPVGAALVGVGITRVLAFVVPASILAGLGLELVLSWVTRRIPYDIVATATFLVLLVTSFSMLRQALVEGPLWFNDYGLYGMQYGAKQLFEETIPNYLASDSSVRVMVSPTWANGTDRFPRFFLSPAQQSRVGMYNAEYYLYDKRALNRNILLIMTPTEYEKARTSPKIKSVDVEQVIPYPDGRPGFYFARMSYADNVDTLFAADREARQQLVEDQIELGGQTVTVRHSRFDAGQLRNILDDDPFTLARGQEANPLVIEMHFPEPRPVAGLAADFGSM
ncbi:MAG: YfhO family protein, partial [Anaerolineae bacterium]